MLHFPPLDPRARDSRSLSWDCAQRTTVDISAASCDMSGDLGSPPELIPGGERSGSSTATSRTLLEQLRADDAAAWDRLVALYAPLVYQWCRRWDLPEQEIAD